MTPASTRSELPTSGKSVQPLGFRKDVEGLRGVAVLLVVLYHVGLPGVAGGYVGVDVFFVLSGYLITRILVDEVVATGTIDLARFYARRMRRLLPAMFLLLVVVTVFGYSSYAPLEQLPIARTATAAAAYVSNFHFAFGATDYLRADAESDPLLHTWSLSVEEQFYLVWPALVLTAMKGSHRNAGSVRSGSRTRLTWTMLAVSLASFALTLLMAWSSDTPWAFFFPLTRAWEFAVGGLASLVPPLVVTSTAGTFSGRIGRLFGWGGLIAVLTAALTYSARTSFPGIATLLPALGTAVVLRAGAARETDALERFFAWGPLQVMGRLSYSWYLWHWSVLVFAEGMLGELALSARIGLAGGSLLLAGASYRWIEKPVRHHSFFAARSARGLLLGATLTLCGVGIGLGWGAIADAGSRLPDQVRYTAMANNRPDIYPPGCVAGLVDATPNDCSLGPSDAQRTIALYGDSHAAQWGPAILTVAGHRGWRVVPVLKSACPVADVSVAHPAAGGEYTGCAVWRKAALEKFAEVRPDVVVAASYAGYDVDPSAWSDGMSRTLQVLSTSATVVLLLKDHPRPGFHVPGCLARRSWQQRALPFRPGSCAFEARNRRHEAIFAAERRAAESFENVRYIDLNERICPGRARCPVEIAGQVVYRDASHLAWEFTEQMSPVIDLLIPASVEARP